MNRALFHLRLRQLHLWLALAIGAQVGLWLISGLFMVWFPIEEVRGEHLVAERHVALDWPQSAITAQTAMESAGVPRVSTITARRLADIPVWQVDGGVHPVLIDAREGTALSPLARELAIRLGEERYIGQGRLDEAVLLETGPREYGRAGPVWRLDFAPPDAATLYVDASTGEVRAVRTGLWRTFDFMWGLHIMDWSSRENFNSWWLKMTASLAVLFFLAGLGLLIMRITAMISRAGR